MLGRSVIPLRESRSMRSGAWRALGISAVIGLVFTLVGAAGAIAQDGGGRDVAQPGGDLPGDPQIQLVQVASGLVDPVNIADDGSGKLYIVERIGRIRVLN